MAEIPCQYPGCEFKAENASEAIALAMFQSHLMSHSQAATAPAHSQRLPAIPRPEVKQDISEEDWTSFVAEWGNFKRCTGIADNQVTDQLYQCCEKSLARLLIREEPRIVSQGETELLAAIKRLAVIKIATSVRRTNLISMKQSHGESFREFYANVKAAAATCDFRVMCRHECCTDKCAIDYTSSVVKDVLVAGIADTDIRKDVLAWTELDSKDDKGVVAFVEAKEIAQAAWTGSQTSGTAGVSTYRKGPKPECEELIQSVKQKLSLKGKCNKCNKEIALYKRYQSGKINNTAFKLCRPCHQEENSRSRSNNSGMAAEQTSSLESFFIGGIGGADSSILPPGAEPRTADTGEDGGCAQSIDDQVSPSINAVTLDHHIFTADGWQRASALSHPSLRLRITTCQEDYDKFGITYPRIQPKHIDVVVDSGAQSCLWSRRSFLRSGFTQKDLIPVRHRMKAANTAPITIDGAILIRLSGVTNGGDNVETAVMAYISPDTDNFYLSRASMVQLGIIDRSFPQLGAAPTHTHESNAVTEVAETESTVYAECGCLKRESPPEKPAQFPFQCTMENVDKMRDWLLNRYASSAFNKCPHQKLPSMEGPPIEIHVDPNATPVTLRKPAPVPLHWQEQVEEELHRDVALGVLERVPLGEPTTWCFKMVVTRKDDGSPRRTVDLSPMNKHCERELHTSKSPFTLARSVPDNSVKTVFDAWNGYHSVPIREADRHLTTFTTPWGLFRYKRAPQGFISSGDGYNRRFDDLTAHINRMERCVDDTLIHDVDLEEHWWRAINFIELCARAGIVLNPEKFQFAQSTVNFAGFRITKESVEPLPKYLDAIRGFPTPKSITDIRSWFGLVNQVSHYSQLRDMMSPFRKFLSPKEKFIWTEELDGIFEESKAQILEAIREGVKIFDINRHTCLRTDWSKQGIGYFLAQKHCECNPNRSYGCCPDGWKITLAGSRFLSPAEKNYAPVEGEALAVAWALEQTRYFTMGCNDLKVIVDHKPLTKLFGDRRLDEIDNPRLFRLKRRTLMWKFAIEYQRGSSNPFADAMSRHPNQYAELASASMMSAHDSEEAAYIGGVASEAEKIFAVTWEKVRTASADDQAMCLLADYIRIGFPSSKKDLPESIAGFWEVRDSLRCSEGVIMYKDRIVIPSSLRNQIVQNLHSAHQGVSSMHSRAQTIVYWPGLAADLEEARDACRSCHRNAPSHAKLPPTAPEIPTTPFQMIFADYFQLKAKHYLVAGDRLSGWTEVVQARMDSASSGSKGLCEALRMIIARVGVPEEISSDGGPEFTSKEAADFYARWGIKHRLSSAYFPQSNGRAEVAVRITKRLLEDNMAENGSLNTDKMVRALLQQRNTPDRDCRLSPAEVLFGRGLRDAMPQLSRSVPIFESDRLHNQWHQAWAAKEQAIRSRLVRSCEQLEAGSRELLTLREGDHVFIQNQDKANSRANKWDRQGTVIASKDHDQYLVKVHGSGRLTLRNRRFLRKFKVRTPFIEEHPGPIRGTGRPLSPPAEASRGGPLTQGPSVQEPALHLGRPASPLSETTQGSDVQEPEQQPTQQLVQQPAQQSRPPTITGYEGPPAQQGRQDLLVTRPRGRPPKRRHFNFMSRAPAASGEQEPSCVLDAQCRGDPVQVNQHVGESRRSPRERVQRKTYDASTGNDVNPCG